MSNASPNIPSMMRAIDAAVPCDADAMVVKQMPVPKPGAGEVLIKIEAAGVSRPDIMQRWGKYHPPEGSTTILGLECAGEIVALGEDVIRYKVGDKVCALVVGGGYAEYVAAPEGQCLPIPAGLDVVQAASIPESVFTVWMNLFQLGLLKAGETTLIHGGSSGVGTFAIQMAVAAGAKAIVTVGNDAKAEACVKLGATLAINYKTRDFPVVVNHFTNKEGVDVILDMIGADYVPRNLQTLAPGGRHVSISTQHGAMAAVNLREVLMNRYTLTGSTLRPRSVKKKSALAAEIETYVWPWIVAGKVKPQIYKTFKLEEVGAAHTLLESSAHIGKIVLTL